MDDWTTSLADAPEDVAPPLASLDAESAVLGAILAHSGVLDDVAEVLGALDFFAQIHGTIYQAILDCRDAGRGIDPISVANQVRAATGEDVLPRLSMLLDASTGPTMAVVHARSVRDYAVRRALCAVCAEVVANASDPAPVADLLGRAEERIRDLADGEPDAAAPVPMVEAVPPAFA